MTMQQVELDNTKAHIEEKLASYFGVTPADASIDQMYKAVSMRTAGITEIARSVSFRHPFRKKEFI